MVEPGFDASHLRALLAVLETRHDRSAKFACVGWCAGTRIWLATEATDMRCGLIVWRSE